MASKTFVEMRGVLGHQLGLRRRGQTRRALSHAVFDQPLDVGADEHLFRQVEFAIDMAEGRQVEDDRAHLIVGDGRIGIQFQHGGAIVAWVASRGSDSERGPASVA